MDIQKILVVDDEEDNIIGIEETLSNEHCEIIAETDPLRGLELFEKEKPPLVILDLRMPGLDGTEFLRRIHPASDKLFSVIVLTGHGDDNDLQICYDLGASAFLRKPVNIIELRGMARNLLLLERHKRELEQHHFNLEKLVDERTKELQEAKRAAQAETQAKCELLVNMSGELRNPLTALVRLSKLLQDEIYGTIDKKRIKRPPGFQQDILMKRRRS